MHPDFQTSLTCSSMIMQEPAISLFLFFSYPRFYLCKGKVILKLHVYPLVANEMAYTRPEKQREGIYGNTTVVTLVSIPVGEG